MGNDLRQRYARWRSTSLGRITESIEIAAIFDVAGTLESKRVLDAGTGDGTYAIEAAARGALVTALDVDAGMLAAARMRATERGTEIVLGQGSVEELPFADNAFDVVFAVTVLCFVADVPVALREMSRVLAPGGRLVLGDLGRFSAWAATRRLRGWLGASHWRNVRFHSLAELRLFARAAGLRVTRSTGSVFFPPCGVAALIMRPFEAAFTRLHAPGAAFIVVVADKPKVA